MVNVMLTMSDRIFSSGTADSFGEDVVSRVGQLQSIFRLELARHREERVDRHTGTERNFSRVAFLCARFTLEEIVKNTIFVFKLSDRVPCAEFL